MNNAPTCAVWLEFVDLWAVDFGAPNLGKQPNGGLGSGNPSKKMALHSGLGLIVIFPDILVYR